jgi:hypothetical protein
MTDEIIRRDVPWREKSRAMKVLVVALSASWIAVLVTGLVVSGIEIVALGQPSDPTPIYNHAHGIKNGIRYFTDAQDWSYSIARPALIASFALCALLATAYESLRRADYNRRKRALFDGIET